MFNSHYLLKKSLCVFNYQTIRWGKPRKPFWLGIAKSKKFIIRMGKKLPEDDETEITRLKKEYEIGINSLYHFIKNQNTLNDDKRNYLHQESASLLQHKINESLARNEIWNAKSAKLRESRLKLSAELNAMAALSKIELNDKANEKHLMMIEEIIQKEKIESLSYITLKNLDEAVDNCINNVVDHNFAIDLNGKKYLGQETLPKTKADYLSDTTAMV